MPQRGAYDFPELFRDFAFAPQFDQNIEALSEMAEPENWDYQNTAVHHRLPILRNYVTYTYRRIAEERKIAVTADEQLACWNTGLITSTLEPLYALSRKNHLANLDHYWHFWKFSRQGEGDLNRFGALPDMAHYFDDPSVLVFDVRKDLRVNVDHVVSDNLDQFPSPLQTMNAFGLQNLVRGAIDSARLRVRRNYKTAIPQYYQGAIQLLLPLSLTDGTRADLALVVDRFPDFYRAATCLTLDMAYNNARQLARPDRDWLAP